MTSSSCVEVCELSPLQSTREPHPADGLPRSPARVEDRLLSYGRVYAERKEQRRLELEAARRRLEAEARAQAAALRSRHKREPPTHTSEEERAARRHAKREALLAAELAEDTHRPQLSAASAELASARRRREHVDGLSTAEALAAQQQRSMGRLEELREAQIRQRCPHHPTISAHAKALRMPLSASERLYALFKEQEREVQEIRETAAKAQSFSFTPRISPRAKALKERGGQRAQRTAAADDSVHTALYVQGRERAVAQEERRRAVTSAHSFHPLINPTSRIIAQQLKESSGERRFAHSANSVAEPRQEQTERDRRRPRRQQQSASLPVHHRTAVWAERRSANLAAAQQQLAVESNAECTFQPRTTPYNRPPQGPEHFWMSERGRSRHDDACRGGDWDIARLLEEVNATLQQSNLTVSSSRSAPLGGRATSNANGLPVSPWAMGQPTAWGMHTDCPRAFEGGVDDDGALSEPEEVDLITQLLCTVS